ncbi:MAG: CRTAC1 family protein [bacterium]|nr:CRTAC1 family protein [bacterium]
MTQNRQKPLGHRRFRVAGLLVGVCLFTAAAAEAPAPPLQHPGTKRMAERLRVVAATSSPWGNPYLNSRRAQALRGLPTTNDPREASLREFRLARELLLAGDAEEAVARLRALTPVFGADRIRGPLATALLRLGEQENCLARHTSESCLVPIRGSGVYTEREPTRQAIVELGALLEADAQDLTSRWLLNLAHMTLGDYPDGVPEAWRIPPPAFRSEHDVGRFPDVARRSGVDVVGLAGGTVVEDFDGDGDLDLMTSSSGLTDPLRFFRNRGDGTFEERTREAGLTGIVGGLNLIHADYDNDGHPDVLVLRGAWLGVKPATDGGRHPNSLLRNLGDGTFEDVTDNAGLLEYRPTQTAAFADYDNDGRLDLFVGHETFGQEVYPCRLYRNNGDGTFTDRALEAGVAVVGLVKGVAWGDYDNDGLQDLYVSRLGSPNLLYHNLGPDDAGRHRFEDVTARAGVAQPQVSFPTWFWDYDNDGWLDLFVSGYGTGLGSQAADVAAEYLGLATKAERPRLYRNNGDGTFADVTRETRTDRVAFTMGCNFGDLDNDGWLDAYLGTGDPDLRAIIPNRMLRNDAGKTFQEVSTSGGFGHIQKGHGIAFADLDEDGDQDVYMNVGGFFEGDVFPNVLFENPGHGNRFIKLVLVGKRSNRSAFGARIRITARRGEQAREIHAVVDTGGSFGSSPLRREIGLGAAESIDSVEVVWPASGLRTTLRGLELDGSYRLVEGASEAQRLDMMAGAGD